MTDREAERTLGPTISESGVRKWSTDDVPQSQRLDYWVGAICEGFEELEASSSMVTAFGASLESAHCGQVLVNQVVGSAQDVFRTRTAISRSADSCFYLLCKLDAPWAAGQKHGVSRLLPGDCMLFDSKQPYELHFAGSADVITLKLPVDWVEAWLADPEGQCGLRIDATNGWGQPLSNFVRQLTPEMAAAPPLPSALMTDQLGSLLSLGTHDLVPDQGLQDRGVSAFIRKAVECVQRRHGEFGLTAQAIAQELHVSERTLHRYFARSGATFQQHLMKKRMGVAEAMLRDPRFDRISVSEIGRRVGLADTSHFIRQCRTGLGVTPATIRQSRSA
ncbi:helix-turn-helix domain-containing protein [Variovorax sp. J22P168]|uniref:helix-turn-helix domain-containing protein n=1 Tax=Variovorax jilinensis TaxID=3053513 RepID=UPI002577D31D|nr:helix-turn-helix domain-containing protein [Variovorax sp. J22P168]MDM0015068.1 helix-turn-helix domain-containing protein [Variovorax sp. J22P168]